MVETGAITDAQREKALASSPKVYKSAPDAASQYFVDWVDAQFKAMGPPKLDLIVETTLDARDEAAADVAAKSTIERFAHADVREAALVALDPAGPGARDGRRRRLCRRARSTARSTPTARPARRGSRSST